MLICILQSQHTLYGGVLFVEFFPIGPMVVGHHIDVAYVKSTFACALQLKVHHAGCPRILKSN